MASDPPEVDHEAFRQQMAQIVSGRDQGFDGDDPCWAVAATGLQPPKPDAVPADSASPPTRGEGPAQAGATSAQTAAEEDFVPLAPASLQEAGLHDSQVEALILKFLLNRGTATGWEITDQVKLPFGILGELLRRMKDDRLVIYKASAPMSDYLYELTELGFDRARRYSLQCTYFGAAPVPLGSYVASVAAQSIRKQNPTLADLRRALADMVLGDEILSQLGQAIISGLGLFLFGAPGNGKTNIAQRITRAFGEALWIPRALSAVGEIIRLYDPNNHQEIPLARPDGLYQGRRIDRRWIHIRRPTIVVGGELTMSSLEITTNKATGLSEAPLQLKSNGGTLVIDDFGRQRVGPNELLNRWIVPLELRYDFLNLISGRKIQVPFDQLIIFSTNLEPRELVDEAFLRRIPYKIDVKDPTEAEFLQLMRQVAAEIGIEYEEGPIEYLLERHYRASGRPLRFCHPRDLLHQVRVFSQFYQRPAVLSNEAIDAAVKNYFAMM